MTWILTLGVFLICVVGMSVGVVLAGKRLQGSCGGLAAGLAVDQDACPCGKKVGSCEDSPESRDEFRVG